MFDASSMIPSSSRVLWRASESASVARLSPQGSGVVGCAQVRAPNCSGNRRTLKLSATQTGWTSE